MNDWRFASIAALSLTLIAACGAGKAGEAVRPNDPTFVDARGGSAASCHDVGDEGTPLIVDWTPEARADLEVAMKQGVAVVHYDCNSIKVLGDCHVDGNYAYVGTSKKEQLISLDNADEAQANLPLSGAKIGAGLARGSSLDIGLIMVGKKSTTSLGVDRSKLVGRCDGATHYVRSATVGAFAMKTGTKGEVSTAVDVFGVGASANSSSSKTATNKDGDVASCQTADPDAPKAPAQCGGALRVQLLAVTGAPPTSAPKDQEKDVACGKGLVASQGKCAPATADAPHDCDLSAADCEKQCNAGSGWSCNWAGGVYDLGLEGKVDNVKAATFYRHGCEALKHPGSCESLGVSYMKGEGVTKDVDKGVALVKFACSGGDATACGLLGDGYNDNLGRIGVHLAADVPRAARYYARSCSLGDAFSCGHLARMLTDGKNGVTPDPALVQRLFRQACAGWDKDACQRVGMKYPGDK